MLLEVGKVCPTCFQLLAVVVYIAQVLLYDDALGRQLQDAELLRK
jgi:hypothetical protein